LPPGRDRLATTSDRVACEENNWNGAQIMGDRVQLQQVMMNLITNSIDAMKAAIAHRAHP